MNRLELQPAPQVATRFKHEAIRCKTKYEAITLCGNLTQLGAGSVLTISNGPDSPQSAYLVVRRDLRTWLAEGHNSNCNTPA